MHAHLDKRPEWLALTREEAIDPTRPVIDAHHHLWTAPRAPYLAQDYAADAALAHNVLATVFVECHTNYRVDGPAIAQPLGEIQFAVDQSGPQDLGDGRTVDIARALVGSVNLLDGPKVEEVLLEAARLAKGKLRGIRNITAWHPDPQARASAMDPPPGTLLHPGFRTGFALLEKHGLSFDAWLTHNQLHELRDLADTFGDTKIVINHCGGPLGIGPYANRRRFVWKDWNNSLVQLASHANVVIKIGGLGMRWPGLGLESLPQAPSSEQLCAAWSPYIEACAEAFGPDRCMFESNFPVDNGLCSYTILWNAFKRATAGWKEHERNDIFFGTASRTYRLGLAEE